MFQNIGGTKTNFTNFWTYKEENMNLLYILHVLDTNS